MLNEMLKKQNVLILDSVNDWKEAIHLSVKLLVNGGYVTNEYARAIIQQTEKLGPYYILAPSIALPHARPEMGVKEKQLSVLLVKKGVLFPKNNTPVHLIIILAATDSLSHLDVLKDMATILMNNNNVKHILESKTTNELYSYFIK